MVDLRDRRASIGTALLASAAVILLVASLVGTGVLELDEEVRPTIVAALGAVAVLDLVLGLWFLKRGR